MRIRSVGQRVAWTVFGIAALQLIAAAPAQPSADVAPVPDAERARLELSPFYTQYLSGAGIPIVASAKTNPFALKEAGFLMHRMLGNRPDIVAAMNANGVRFSVMAVSELTTDVPEHSDLTPKEYWDRRARGLGATPERPSVSCGEENLLCLKGDPYGTENILIHEFSHAIHEMGMSKVDPTFDTRLEEAYVAAKAEGLWKNTYAMSNRAEYFAEGVQSWFDCNRANDSSHGTIDTREELKPYDPRLVKLIIEVFGEDEWRYTRPTNRTEPAHLAGFDREAAPAFAWPQRSTTQRSTSQPASLRDR